MHIATVVFLSVMLPAAAFAQGLPIPNYHAPQRQQLPPQATGCPQQGTAQPTYQAAPQDQFTTGLTSILGAARGLLPNR